MLLSIRKVIVAVSSISDVANDNMQFGLQRETIHEDIILAVEEGAMKVSLIKQAKTLHETYTFRYPFDVLGLQDLRTEILIP